MGQHIDEIVSLVLGGRDRVARFGGRMSEGGVDDPPLPFSRCPDRIAVPHKRVLGLAVPLEVADVPGLPVHRMTIKCAHNRDACVNAGSLPNLCLGRKVSRQHRSDQKCRTHDANPTVLHQSFLLRVQALRLNSLTGGGNRSEAGQAICDTDASNSAIVHVRPCETLEASGKVTKHMAKYNKRSGLDRHFSRRRIVVVVPPVDELDLVGPLQVFSSVNRLAGRNIYAIAVVTNNRPADRRGARAAC